MVYRSSPIHSTLLSKEDKTYYSRGHSDHTVALQQQRTADSDAAFLLPYIKKTDHILDVGCGPGTITTSLARHASEGRTVGIDISSDILQKARTLAIEANISTEGPGAVIFEKQDALERLAYPDNTFDIIFSSQFLGHLPAPELPIQALSEMRRVLKPGGILATRDATSQHFYPQSLDLDHLWLRNQLRASRKGKPEADPTGTIMLTLFRGAGFDVDGGKVRLGAGTKVFWGRETRKGLAQRAVGQLQPGDPFYQSWLDAGISVDEINARRMLIRG
ncbi:putative Methyltransf_25 domain-containing protein [Seiridium cardinale]